MAVEEIAGQQIEDLVSVADHNLGVERQPPRDLRSQISAADALPDHQSAGRADVDRVEMLQLRGENLRPELPMTSDVQAAQKNDERHTYSESGTVTVFVSFDPFF